MVFMLANTRLANHFSCPSSQRCSTGLSGGLQGGKNNKRLYAGTCRHLQALRPVPAGTVEHQENKPTRRTRAYLG
jgi:hypothetical protein